MNDKPKSKIKAEAYIKKYNLDVSAEQLFMDFEKLNQIYFENLKSNKMYRCKSSLEKRTLFIQWYFNEHQNALKVRQMIKNLAEMLFVSEKTIERELKKDTTGTQV